MALTLTPGKDSPVTSERTCPTTTPSATTLTPREAVAVLPAVSVAVTATVTVSPGTPPDGTERVPWKGLLVNVPSGVPSTLTTNCATAILSVTATVNCP